MRLTDHDKQFGPLTIGRSMTWRPWRLVWSSGCDGDVERAANTLTVCGFGWIVQLRLPTVLRAWCIRHRANWDAETIARFGRDWYYETYSREYGFSLCDGFLQLFFGPQTNDSITTRNWCAHLPWTQWRHVRFSLYRPDGLHFWTQCYGYQQRDIDYISAQLDAEKRCPKASFLFDDFDGERITATCHIEEHEYKFGAGWFKWLSLFHKAKISRSLRMHFSAAVGPDKWTWKGGTIGGGMDMAPGESCESAFRRYCEQEHLAQYRKFQIALVGAAR